MTHSPDDRFQQLRTKIHKALQAGLTVLRQDLISKHPDLADRLNQLFAEIDVTPPVNDSNAATLLPVTDAVANAPDELATLPPASDAASASLARDAATLFPPAEFAPTGVRRNGAATEPDLTPASAGSSGTRVRYFGDYELISEIARGGMGVVYKARQVNLNRIVALKMILSGQLASDEDIRRFHTEAESAAHLDHPGIVPIYEIGEHDGQHYFSMGYVDGKSLADRVKDGPLPPHEAASLTRKISEAIAYAHEKGVIHRDLKPANVLLDAGGEPKVTDFGLARKLEQDSGLTRTGAVMGTPSYMPPEQAAGETDKVGPLADVYSLGAMLYCLLTGRPPFQAANPLDTLLQVMEREPIAPTELAPTIPKDLETICLKCLQKDRLKRYESANDLAADIGRWERGEPIRARAVSRAERVYRWVKRNRLVSGLMAGTAIGLICAVVFGIQATSSERTALRAEQQAKASEFKVREVGKKTEAALVDSTFLLASAKLEKRHATEAAKLLEQIPEQYRTFEWHLTRQQAEGSEDFSSFGRAGSIANVSFSPDGKWILAGGHSNEERYDRRNGVYGTIEIWNATTGELVKSIQDETVVECHAIYHPDGKKLLSFPTVGNGGEENRGIKLWDTDSGEFEYLSIHSKVSYIQYAHVSFSPDGKYVWSSENSEDGQADAVVKRSLHTREEIDSCITSIKEAYSVLISPQSECVFIVEQLHDAQRLDHEGNFVASYSARIVSLSTKEVTWQIELPGADHYESISRYNDGVKAVLSADNSRIALGLNTGTVFVLNALTGSVLKEIAASHLPLVCVVFSPDDSKLLTVDADGMMKLWDVATGSLLGLISEGRSQATCAAFSPDGSRIVAGDNDGGVRVWSVGAFSAETLQVFADVGQYTSHAKLLFSPDGQQLAVALVPKEFGPNEDFGFLRIIDASDGRLIRTINVKAEESEKYAFRSFAYNHDGSRIVAAGEVEIKQWDEKNAITRIVSPGKGEIRQWDTSTGSMTGVINAHVYGSIKYSSDGKRIVGFKHDMDSHVDSIGTWDSSTCKQLYSMPFQREMNVKQVLARSLMAVRNAFRDESYVNGYGLPSGSIEGSSISYDDTQMAVLYNYGPGAGEGDEFHIDIWDVTQQQRLHSIKTTFGSIKFNANGTKILLHNGGESVIVNSQTGEIGLNIQLSGGFARFAKWTPDGTRFLTGGRNSPLTIWSAATGQELCVIDRDQSVLDFCFSPNGRRIAAITAGGKIKMWDTENDPSYDKRRLFSKEEVDKERQSGYQPYVKFGQDGKMLALTFRKDTSRSVSAPPPVQIIEGLIDALMGTEGNSKSVSFWDIASNGRVEIDDIPDFSAERFIDAIADISPDGRWRVMERDDGVFLVDLRFQPSVTEMARLERKAKPTLGWHEKEAVDAKERKDFYAEAFHRAWIMQSLPTDAWAYDDLQQAYRRLLADRNVESSALPVVVSQMLALTRGNDLPRLSEDTAERINSDIWAEVKTPGEKATGIFEWQLQRMEDICVRYPQRRYLLTLGVIHFRLGQYEAAIRRLKDARSMDASQGMLDDSVNVVPASDAFLAICHHKVGQLDLAAQHYASFRSRVIEPYYESNHTRELKLILKEVNSHYSTPDSISNVNDISSFNSDGSFEKTFSPQMGRDWRFLYHDEPGLPDPFDDVISEQSHSGLHCLSLKCGSSPLFAYKPVAVESQSRYRLTGWIRTENVFSTSSEPNPAHGVSVGIRPADETADWTSENGSVAVIGTTEWTQVTFEFQTGDATTMQVGCRSRDCTGTAWFDDLHLEKLE